MSFSSDVKKEALGAKISKNCCQKAFFLACFAFGGRILGAENGRKLIIGTDNQELAKIISGTAKRLFDVKCEIREGVKNKSTFYDVTVLGEEEIIKILRALSLAENSSKSL